MNTESHPFTPLAIVGIGCLFPKADGPGAFWANVKHGVDGITEVPPTHWDPADYFDADPKRPDMTYARRGGFLSPVEFNPLEFGIAPRDIEATDTAQLLGLVAAKQALADAGVHFTPTPTSLSSSPPFQGGAGGGGSSIQSTPPGPPLERGGEEQPNPLTPNPSPAGGEGGKRPTPRDKVSVILGVTGTLELVVPLGARLGHPKWKRALKEAGVADDVAADVVDRIGDSYVPWQENSFPGLLGNVVAGRIANKLDLHGTNCVVDAACASSLSAVHLASMELQTGKADVVVTGGVDTFNDIFMFMCFSKTPALAKSGDSKPFDANGDGTILGEGIGVVVLKRLADADRDGDRVYAVIRGVGTSSDGKGNAIYAPSADGQQRCLTDAYARAGIDPRTVELVEAHGTGTRVGDAVEATALTAIFSREPEASASAQRIALGSVKSQIGHTKAAAGAASLIKTALSLYNKVLPPTLKVTKPVAPLDSPDSPFSVNVVMRPWLPTADHPRRAGLSAFGFGGSNFHAVLEEHSPTKAAPDWDGQVEILAGGAATPQELATALAAVPTAWADFARAAEASRTSFDPTAPCRLLLVAHRTHTDLPKLVAATSAKLAAEPNAVNWSIPDGAHFGRGEAAGKLAVLFPGQGSQRVGMLRELACTFPELLDALAGANEPIRGVRLSESIYPPTSYAQDAKAKQDEALKATDVAQPALGAVSYGAFKLLRDRFGVTAAAFAGHSYGELPALAAAGRIAEPELVKLSRLRGSLMAGRKGDDPGAMLAVLGPAADVERVVKEVGAGVVVANRNSPTQTVLSGPTAGIETAEAALRAAKLKGVRLPVAAAFHSSLVADTAPAFRAVLEKVEFRPAAVPVFANTTAAEYPADPAAARDLLGHQLAKPVEFVRQIRAMLAAGVRTFLEVGPGGVLTKLTEAIVADAGTTDAVAFALDASAGKSPGTLDLAHALAKLAARGHLAYLGEWEKGSACRPAALPTRPVMTVALTGANHVSPRAKKPPRPALHSANGSPKTASAARPPAAEPRRMNEPTTPDLPAALQATQQTLAALQQLQQQTAQLHRQFLDQQEHAQRTLMALVQQQQALLTPGAAVQPFTLPPSAPRPVAPPPPAYVPPPPVVLAPSVPPPAVAPKPAPQPPTVQSSGAGNIEKLLLDVVAEKTGYPASMLGLGMTLDADLGVDSIKRVEILSALQDKLPNAPVVKPEHLGTLHTLQDVADFLTGGTVAPSANGLHVPEPPLTVPFASPLAGPMSTRLLGPATGASSVAELLIQVVAEKTGYPASMLGLGMTLDADLGVDSIKRVEILSALQDKLPHAPVVKPEHLGTLHTLQDVADFLTGGAPPKTEPLTPELPKSEPTPASTAVTPVVMEETASKLTASELAPDTEHISAVPMADAPPAAHPAVDRADTVDLGFLDPPRTGPPVQQRSAASITGTDPVERSTLQVMDLDLAAARPRLALPDKGEVWLVAGDDPLARELGTQLAKRFTVKSWKWVDPAIVMAAGSPVALVLLAPAADAPDALNKLAVRWLQQAGPKLRAAGKNGAAAVLTVARLDGAFGLGDLSGAADPTSGGLAALPKTVRHEWPEVSTKAVDVAPAFAAAAPQPAAAAVVDELLTVGPIEVGVDATHRCTLELARASRKPAAAPVSFGPRDVVLVTGGGRGVTAETAVALAEAFRPALVLTGRTPAPQGPEPAWSAGIVDDASLKQLIAKRLGAAATPKAVGEQYDRLMAQRDIRATLARIEEVGGRALYVAADVADPRQAETLLHQAQVKFGPVTGLVHGAGVLADRKIEELPPDRFDAVYATKVGGLRTLLDLLGGQELKALVLFSSTTARLGRTGQLAYAVANEVLNKTAQAESRRRPACKVVAINWGPWDGGMVTPALKKVFDAEGVGLIPLEDGGAFLVNELGASGRAVEVVALGKRAKKAGGSAGVPAAATTRPEPTAPAAPAAPAMPPAAELPLAFERTVDLASHPVLRSHVIDGRAVLPMALHMEWLAHAALHGHPGLVFHGFNEVRMTHGVMVDEGGAAPVRAVAGKAAKRDDGLFYVPVELRGKRRDGREVMHSRADVVLATALPAAPKPDAPPPVEAYPHPLDEIYRYFLFHGPDLHGVERVDGMAEAAFVGSAYPAPTPGEWLAKPLRNAWIADPLVLDASFQMMILWSFAQHGAGSLPCFAGRYRQYRRSFPAAAVTVVARVTRDNGSFARADIQYLDSTDGSVVATIQDYECVIDPQLNQAFRRNQLSTLVRA